MLIDGGRSLRASELPRPSAKPHPPRHCLWRRRGGLGLRDFAKSKRHNHLFRILTSHPTSEAFASTSTLFYLAVHTSLACRPVGPPERRDKPIGADENHDVISAWVESHILLMHARWMKHQASRSRDAMRTKNRTIPRLRDWL